MNAATRPRERTDEVRLLLLDTSNHRIQQHSMEQVADLLEPGDLMVVNDAATLPGALTAHTEEAQPLGLRLVRWLGPARWQAVLFAAGSWRLPTEELPPAPRLEQGHVLRVAEELDARVEEINERSHRIVSLRFDSSDEEAWQLIYAHGRPIQYSYLEEDLALWDVQTAFATRPWAAELPSASKLISAPLLQTLRARGIALASVTHATGISSTGDRELDALLPFAERYEVPAATVAAIRRTHQRGGRVIAAGTSVVRALEGCAHAHGGRLVAGSGVTDYLLSAHTRLRVVDGVLSGLHMPGESHYELLKAFAPEDLLRRSNRIAVENGFLAHEFGDGCLILGTSRRRRSLGAPVWPRKSWIITRAAADAGPSRRSPRSRNRRRGCVR